MSPCECVERVIAQRWFGIVSYTGLSIVDLDDIVSERMAEVLEEVRNDDHSQLAYTTISGERVRVIARFAFSKEDNENRECFSLWWVFFIQSFLVLDFHNSINNESSQYNSHQNRESPISPNNLSPLPSSRQFPKPTKGTQP